MAIHIYTHTSLNNILEICLVWRGVKHQLCAEAMAYKQ